MLRPGQLRFALLLGALLCATGLVTLAETGFLVVHVKDVQERPIAGLQIGVKGDGGSAITGDDGKARIQLAKQTKENDWVSLQILKSPPGKDLMMVSPWDYGTFVPSFTNESKNVVEIVVVQRGDRIALASGTVLRYLAEQINKANAPGGQQNHIAKLTETLTTSDNVTGGKNAMPLRGDKGERTTEQEKREALAAVASSFEMPPEEIDKAIRAWGAKATDPYEAGLAALYERNYPKASGQFADSLQLREEKLAANQKAVADAAFFLGQSLFEEGKYRDAATAYQRCLQLRSDDMAATSGLGLSLFGAGDYAASEPLLQRVVEVFEKTRTSSLAPVVLSLNNLAALRKAKGQYAESEQLLRRALELAKETLAPDNPAVVTTVSNLAVVLKTEGKYKEAEPLYRIVAEIDQRISGPDSVNLANSLYNLAQLLLDEGNHTAAEPLFRRALGIVESKLPAYHPSVADCLRGLGELLLAEGDLADAEPLLTRALDIDEKILGPNHPQVGDDLNDLASLLRRKQLYNKAEPLARRALAISEAAYGQDHPEVATSLNNLGVLLANEGEYAGAEALERRALTILEKALGPDHPQTQGARRNLQALLDQEAAKKTEK
jgi:tetratricopeptide (TPR) repeat protein